MGNVLEERGAEKHKEDVECGNRKRGEDEGDDGALECNTKVELVNWSCRLDIKVHGQGKRTEMGLGPELSAFLRSPGLAFFDDFDTCVPATGMHSTAYAT